MQAINASPHPQKSGALEDGTVCSPQCARGRNRSSPVFSDTAEGVGGNKHGPIWGCDVACSHSSVPSSFPAQSAVPRASGPPAGT